MTHALERTSPFGKNFIGRCMLCGETGLKMSEALQNCENPAKISQEDALVMAIEGDDEN